MEDNISRQVEEVEALCSIYGDQWHIEDESNQTYSISFSEGDYTVQLHMTLPEEYPSHSPPIYQLSAPKMNREEKLELAGILENIFLDNIGENILYQWIEAAKDFLHEKFNLKSLERDLSGLDIDNGPGDVVLDQSITMKDMPLVIHGETIVDRKSIFQGHVASVISVDQVKLVLSKLMENKKIAQATHNIYAYRIEKGGQHNVVVQDCEDDGETAAGSRLLHLLQIMDVMNIVVVVSRWYGGIHLGSDRFRHINNAARQVLEKSGLVTKKK